MVTRSTNAIFCLFQILRDIFLEVHQTSIRDEDIGKFLIAFMADTQKLNLLGIVR